MTALLILLYVLRANGVVVPDGCLFFTWIAWSVKLLAFMSNAGGRLIWFISTKSPQRCF